MRHKKLFWLDLETTGLDVDNCHILEIGVSITNINYVIIDSFHLVIHQPRYRLRSMNTWCRLQHRQSGLIKETQDSLISLFEAQTELLNWMDKHNLKNDVVLHGSSIHFDRKFIRKYLPLIEDRLHYRMVDVTSFKIALYDKFKIEYNKEPSSHRAIDDVQQSINEFKFYMAQIKGGG